MNAAARVLLVDDDAIQLRLNTARLRDAGYEVETAGDVEGAIAKARAQRHDVIMSDVVMGDEDGFGLCRRLRSEPTLDGTPVILLSAHFGEDEDQALATRVGAAALVQRTPTFEHELAVLRACLADKPAPAAVMTDSSHYEAHLHRSAHQLAKLAREVQTSRERYRMLFEHASDAVSVLDPEGTILEANRRCGEMFDLSPDEMVGRHIREFAVPGDGDQAVATYNAGVDRGASRVAMPLVRRDGSTIVVESSTNVIELDGQKLVLAISRDVSDAVKATRALAQAEARYRALIERIPDVVCVLGDKGDVSILSPNIVRVSGFTSEEVEGGGPAFWRGRVHLDDRARVADAYAALTTEHKPFDLEYRWQHKDGQWLWLWSRCIGIHVLERGMEFEIMVSDVTEKKRLEEQVRLSQKMEAIGQLTGGIAHDFNNILAVILANSRFLMETLGAHDERRADVEEIQHAADRAAALTRQLLAFSRRQVLEPSIMHVGSVVTGLESMLRRLIGEDIALEVITDPDTGNIRADVGQIEQVIMNLAVNARDAMPKGGKLAIETMNVTVDAAWSSANGNTKPGDYVLVAVSDTGCGMDAATQARIFEPFFTTKALGKGTGLGLATSYGIVKQSGGYIWVYGEPGRGTVFKVYLPRIVRNEERIRSKAPPALDLNGSETVLLLEDDASVRSAVARILTGYGYRVLPAGDGDAALATAQSYGGPIHLIVSDVVMPGGSGPDVVERLHDQLSAARSLFMSGYTDHAALRDGVIEATMNFIQKPFSPEGLAKKVRAVLDA